LSFTLFFSLSFSLFHHLHLQSLTMMVFSNAANFIIVYGIWRPHSGVSPLYSPPIPSVAMNLGMPSDKPRANPGTVCTFTFTASKGQRPMSAKNSAEAEPARKTRVWYLAAFSGPTASA